MHDLSETHIIYIYIYTHIFVNSDSQDTILEKTMLYRNRS